MANVSGGLSRLTEEGYLKINFFIFIFVFMISVLSAFGGYELYHYLSKREQKCKEEKEAKRRLEEMQRENAVKPKED